MVGFWIVAGQVGAGGPVAYDGATVTGAVDQDAVAHSYLQVPGLLFSAQVLISGTVSADADIPATAAGTGVRKRSARLPGPAALPRMVGIQLPRWPLVECGGVTIVSLRPGRTVTAAVEVDRVHRREHAQAPQERDAPMCARRSSVG